MSQSVSSDTTPFSFRVPDEKKRMMKMRAVQLGYDSTGEYLRDLVDGDLEEAELPDLE